MVIFFFFDIIRSRNEIGSIEISVVLVAKIRTFNRLIAFVASKMNRNEKSGCCFNGVKSILNFDATISLM